MNGVIEPSLKQGNNEFDFVKYVYDYQKQDEIYYSVLDENLTRRMKEYCDNVRKNSSAEWLERSQKGLAGNIREEYGLTLLEDRELYTVFYENLREIVSKTIGFEVMSFTFSGMWVNYQKPNEFNPIHNHTGNLSLVWYLDVPQIIRDEYKKSSSNSPSAGLICFLSQFCRNSEMNFNPNTNDLLLFNSLHRHQVYPYRSDVERVSLSANITNIVLYSPNAPVEETNISGGVSI